MNDSSLDKKKTDIDEFVTVQETVTQDNYEEADHTVYRYVKMATDTEIPFEQVLHESPDIGFGNVIEIKTENGKKDYFSVDHVVEGEITTVYLVRARNSLWKTLLLLAILGIGWYSIDLLLKRFL